MTKQQVNGLTSTLHQWMTIVGFPVLILLVGDIYTDFKQIRTTVIKHEEKIESLNKTNESQDSRIETLSQYVFSGIYNRKTRQE